MSNIPNALKKVQISMNLGPNPETKESPLIKPAVVTVGDELILGERNNDNEKWLLRLLCERERPAQLALTLPDKSQVIGLWLRRLLDAGCYPVIVSGGIGGTHDDCTRQGVGEALGLPLEIHETCYRLLEKQYGERFNRERQRMAHLPKGCALIANENGAPGFHIGGIYAFPGFPRMLQAMVLDLAPHILPTQNPKKKIVREYTVPAAEGDIAGEIELFTREFPQAHVGVYPKAHTKSKQVLLRIRCQPDDKAALASFEALVRAHMTQRKSSGGHLWRDKQD
jgi:molybdopterin-biosynthesis enzyme MoeA-like protein